jgi:hypothetical protein
MPGRRMSEAIGRAALVGIAICWLGRVGQVEPESVRIDYMGPSAVQTRRTSCAHCESARRASERRRPRSKRETLHFRLEPHLQSQGPRQQQQSQDQTYRLIVGYHGLNGTAKEVSNGNGTIKSVYGLWDLAGGSTIFVAPQGINNGWSNSGGADVELSRQLIIKLEDELCIDVARR